MTDADIMIDRQLRRLASELNDNDKLFYRGWTPGGYGTMVIRREMFHAVGGYDERMEGWGGSDDDLYLRLTLRGGIQFANIPEGIRTYIDHPEEARHETRTNFSWKEGIASQSEKRRDRPGAGDVVGGNVLVHA